MSKFRDARKKAGITQVTGAKALNIAQATISMWETGKNFPKAETLPKIAALYGCTIEDLLDVDKEAKGWPYQILK